MASELIQSSIDIDAPPAAVWAVVSDLRRMGEWSPQCKKMIVFGGDVKKGSRTLNLNAAGKMYWPTTARVIDFDPNKKLAFRVTTNRTIWSYELEETETGTRLTESRRAPDGIAPVPNLAVKKVMGGVSDFEAALERGIKKTLTRIKSEVEA